MTEREIRKILSRKVVGLAGCGGLGSNCAVSLARVGVGTLVIVDFDQVSQGNLNRQYYFLNQVGMKKVVALRDNILRIDPAIRVIANDVRLTPENIHGIFNGCDVLVEAFDLAAEKQMLIETVQQELCDIPLVAGLGMAGYGMNEKISCRGFGNLYICGDGETEIGPECPPLGPRVGVVANMQANLVLEILLKST